MKHTITITIAALMLTACTSNNEKLKQRAEELCRFIPDHELLEQSKDYMTADFYATLDTLFNHMPDEQPLEHEWLFYFVTSNGGTIADYTVTSVEQTDNDHAVATINVRQQWEDGSFDSTSDVEEHKLYMEMVDGKWLMSDFDGHKEDCLRHIEIYRQEQAVRDAIGDYLVREIGEHYMHDAGKTPAIQEICVPTIMIIAADEIDSSTAHVWGDFWVDWYRLMCDTLKCISGGNHNGMMTLVQENGQLRVISFEQTVDGAGNDASARRIFGPHYEIYQNIHGNQDIREANRNLQLRNYLLRHSISAHYYQDYGWPPVEIEN